MAHFCASASSRSLVRGQRRAEFPAPLLAPHRLISLLPLHRVTILADAAPPPPPQVYGQPSLPQLSLPIIGTGDAPSLKEAEKLAALHACLQLAARGCFDGSNLPVRMKGMRTPLHDASTGPAASSGKGSGGGGGGGQFTQYPSAPPGQAPAANDGKTVGLSGGQRIGLEEARGFMDFYCEFQDSWRRTKRRQRRAGKTSQN